MEWSSVVNGLIREASAWALAAGFEVTVEPHPELPEVSVLTLEEGRRRIHVEPSVYASHRIPTAVDVYAYPSLVRVRLRGPDAIGAWEIYTSDNLPLRRAWNKDTFLELCADLAVAALGMADFEAIRDVEREYLASGRALQRFVAEWHVLEDRLRQDLTLVQVSQARARLEATYILRILAAFEEALRLRLLEVGVTVGEAAGFRTKCERAGVRFGVDDRLRLLTERMADDRNRLAHGRDLVPRESIRIVAARCRRFLAACG